MQEIIKHTESDSLYDHLEKMSTAEVLQAINQEDHKVAAAVSMVIPQVSALIDAMFPNFEKGGRLIYIGAGTSGRLGVVDASEIPPTFGMTHDRVIGLIAGGDRAIRKAVEFAEDSQTLVLKDLQAIGLNSLDTVVGIAASGTTPYVIAGLIYAHTLACVTSCITCNENTPVAHAAAYPIEVVVGPEFVTGSTRMKSGTAQKMVLNMISTSLMIKYGRVKGNKMVNMQLSNNKLIHRGECMLMEILNIDQALAKKLLAQYKSVDKAVNVFRQLK